MSSSSVSTLVIFISVVSFTLAQLAGQPGLQIGGQPPFNGQASFGGQPPFPGSNVQGQVGIPGQQQPLPGQQQQFPGQQQPFPGQQQFPGQQPFPGMNGFNGIGGRPVKRSVDQLHAQDGTLQVGSGPYNGGSSSNNNAFSGSQPGTFSGAQPGLPGFNGAQSLATGGLDPRALQVLQAAGQMGVPQQGQQQQRQFKRDVNVVDPKKPLQKPLRASRGQLPPGGDHPKISH
ncbi:hypothetical protein AAVH_17974 [Aphelenchoides avenae]|nr:hypothetical protein AAVH_17974 [Aphelenchus avenae]